MADIGLGTEAAKTEDMADGVIWICQKGSGQIVVLPYIQTEQLRLTESRLVLVCAECQDDVRVAKFGWE